MIGFLFSGLSSTGKSTIARIIGQQMDIPVLGEREILRQISREHGFSRTRDWALTVGIEKTMDMALQRTLQAIEERRSHRALILDGCYDDRLLDLMRDRFIGDTFVVIAFDAEIEKRELWMTQRLDSTLAEARKEIQHIDGFKYYAGMANILSRADIRINNDRPLGEVATDLKTRLQEFSAQIRIERDR